MSSSVVVRSAQKEGNEPEENEDRGAYSHSGDSTRMAIADGATESSFSDLWAEVLVAIAVDRGSPDILSEAGVALARKTFEARVPPMDSLAWYASEKLRSGSHAALGVVDVRRTSDAVFRWHARFVGDCEVFVIKRRASHRMIRAAPAVTADSFGYHPSLVSTLAASHLPVTRARGRVSPPFEIWLVTDALAHACLAAVESGRNPWTLWAGASESDEEFVSVVNMQREARRIRNDDVTLVRMWVG
jgi:hypothetical protein